MGCWMLICEGRRFFVQFNYILVARLQFEPIMTKGRLEKAKCWTLVNLCPWFGVSLHLAILNSICCIFVHTPLHVVSNSSPWWWINYKSNWQSKYLQCLIRRLAIVFMCSDHAKNFILRWILRSQWLIICYTVYVAKALGWIWKWYEEL